MGWKLPTLAAVLWVVALGVWAGVAAGPIGGPWGAVAGSVLTVLAGVVTAYIPSFREEFQRRAAERAQAREGLRRAGELPGGGPAGLLDPRRGVVGFTGRDGELSPVAQDDDVAVVGDEDVGAVGGPAGWVLAGPWCACWRGGGQSVVTSVTAARALCSSTMFF